MLASIFQNSKSALAFAASVIVCALILVGPKESGGVLDQAVTTYKDERSEFASNAAMAGDQMSTPPVIGDYAPEVSGLEEPAQGIGDAAAATSLRVVRLDPVTMQPIGEPATATATATATAPGGESAESAAPEAFAPPASAIAAVPQAAAPAAPRDAVVTSRMIRIKPQ